MTPELQRQYCGNAMSVIIIDDGNDSVDPSLISFGKVTNTVLFVRKISEGYQ